MSKTPENALFRSSPAFKKRIMHLIYKQGCTKKEFALRVGVSEPIITRATLDGIIPTVPILITIANSLKISLDYLICRSENPNIELAKTPTTFHLRLEELAKEHQVNYGKIAQKMRFPRTYFYEWQKEKTFPSVDYLVDIAGYFKVTLDYLVGRTDKKTNNENNEEQHGQDTP